MNKKIILLLLTLLPMLCLSQENSSVKLLGLNKPKCKKKLKENVINQVKSFWVVNNGNLERFISDDQLKKSDIKKIRLTVSQVPDDETGNTRGIVFDSSVFKGNNVFVDEKDTKFSTISEDEKNKSFNIGDNFTTNIFKVSLNNKDGSELAHIFIVKAVDGSDTDQCPYLTAFYYRISAVIPGARRNPIVIKQDPVNLFELN